MDELKLNGSGVKDPTAYNAIVKTEGRDDNSEVYAGDVWTRESMNGFKSEVLVLAVNGGIASILGLIPDCDCENRVAVDVDGRVLVSNLAMTQYARTSALEKHLGQISASRLAQIKKRLAEVLGIETRPAEQPEKKAEPVSDVAKEVARKNMRAAFDMMHVQEENLMLKRRVQMLEERIIEREMEIAEAKSC